MPSLFRSLPSALFLAAAFATPFVVVACGDVVEPNTLTSATATTGGDSSSSASASTATSSTGTGGAGGSGGATSTSSVGGAGGSATASAGSSGGAGGGGSVDAGDAGDASDPGDASDAGDPSDASDAAIDPDAPASCGTVAESYAVDPSPHITTCFPVVYSSDPPSSGPHYPIWAAFKTYTTPVPRGFTVHDLEHGAIVISYKCAGGCAAELAALQAFVDARPVDPLCAAPVKSRIVITPDPLLTVPFAAAAWGFTLTSQCFDLPALEAFINAHYAMGPENFCFDGTDVLAPDAGIAADCGAPASDAGSGPG